MFELQMQSSIIATTNSNWSVTLFFLILLLFFLTASILRIDLSDNLNSIHYSFNLCECLYVVALESSSWINSMVFYCFVFFSLSQLFWFNFEYSKRTSERAQEKMEYFCCSHWNCLWIEGTLRQKNTDEFNLQIENKKKIAATILEYARQITASQLVSQWTNNSRVCFPMETFRFVDIHANYPEIYIRNK